MRHAKMDEYESVLLVKQEVFVYKIPPLTTNRGYRAADWNLQNPDWTGRMRLVSKGNECMMKLEDKTSGELFAKCPIDKYPGVAVESVMDSSRYFVIRIMDDNGRSAFIGMGFADRGDSFDLNVALQDHFKWIEKTEKIEEDNKDEASKPPLDLGFKEGQTITINMKIGQKTTGTTRPKAKSSGGIGILPPPPGGLKIAPPPSSTRTISPSEQTKGSLLGSPARTVAAPTANSTAPTSVSPATSNVDLLLDLDNLSLNNSSSAAAAPPPSQAKPANELWGEFASAGAKTSAAPVNNPSSDGIDWIKF